MKIRQRLAAIALLAAIAGFGTYDVVNGNIAVYTGANAGVVVGSVGFEWAGHPGFFICDGQC